MKTPLVLFLVAVPAFFTIACTNAGVSADARIPKVLVIGIDGCRIDTLSAKATPTLTELAAKSRFANNAYAGGPLGTPAQQPTVSGPGWSTILTGVWTDKHKVKGNDFKNAALGKDQYPHFFYRLKTEKPALRIASSSGWDAIEDKIVAPVATSFDFHFKGDGTGDHHEKGDLQVQEKLKARLAGENDDILFIHYDQLDGAGHKYGFGPKTPEYVTTIAAVDALVSEDLAAIRARKTYANEKWLVLVTTDHGGEGRNHGSQSELCRTIFIIANGPGIEPATVSSPVPQAAIAPTVADWMGIPVKSEWGWVAPSFLK